MEKDATACPVCGAAAYGFPALADHFVAQAADSDVAHVMWLNRNVTKFEVDAAQLAALLRDHAEGRPMGRGRVAR